MRQESSHGRRPPHSRSGSPVEDRHHRAALGPHLELLDGRQGQLRGRPGGGRRLPRDRPQHRDDGPRLARVPHPHGHLRGPRARNPPVPGHRHRPADVRQHPPGRPEGRPGVPHRLRRQRPAGTAARAGPAHQHPRGRHRLRRRRPARPGHDPRSRREGPRLRQADGPDADGHPRPHPGLRGGAGRSSAASRPRCRRAATSSTTTARTPTPNSSEPRTGTTTPAPSRTSCAALDSSPPTTRAWNCWNPASCPARCGVRSRVRTRSRRTCTGEWPTRRSDTGRPARPARPAPPGPARPVRRGRFGATGACGAGRVLPGASGRPPA